MDRGGRAPLSARAGSDVERAARELRAVCYSRPASASGMGMFSRGRLRAGVALCALSAALLAHGVRGEVPDYEFREVPQNATDAQRAASKWRYMFGVPAKWIGPLRWKYNHANAPEPWASDRAGTIAKVRAALESWQPSCGVTYVYEGETTVAPNTRLQDPLLGEQPDGENVVGWDALDENTGGVTYAWYDPLAGGSRRMRDADIILSTSLITGDAEMLRTGSHEWGHAIGLAHSDIEGVLMSGPPETAYNALREPRFDDIRGCRCLYGAGTTPAGFACSLPTSLDFGRVAVGSPSAPRAVTITNDGNADLRIDSVLASRGLELVRTGACVGGATLRSGDSCTVQLSVAPRTPGTNSVDALFHTSDGLYRVTAYYDADPGYTPPPSTGVQLVEYYHAGFDHYFLTHLADEIRKLDDGTFAGWTRTGRTIGAWSQPSAGSSPVCRFFSAAFTPKSSHFYTSFAFECDDVKRNPDWTFEGEVFHVALPDAQGACPAGSEAVYRLYNQGQGGAPNHRFTTDAALRAQMMSRGWVPEGTGLGVTMCTPAS